ncbi:IclR family transcriptional regulator [Mycolicibacterium frederiksbergense]|nr:IclR family transcriptional regulator C-terminal domain-containing protein [Mycolicibacterium frederiksbergense]
MQTGFDSIYGLGGAVLACDGRTESTYLGTLDGPMVRYIDAIESSKGLRVAPRLGQLLPAHCTSTGKAMLAQLSTDELRSIYPAEDLEILTPRSISNRTALEAELARVARRGFAVTNEESEESVSAVAVALPADRTPTLLAVNVSMPSIRLNRDELRSIADTLSKTVAEAVEELF